MKSYRLPVLSTSSLCSSSASLFAFNLDSSSSRSWSFTEPFLRLRPPGEVLPSPAVPPLFASAGTYFSGQEKRIAHMGRVRSDYIIFPLHDLHLLGQKSKVLIYVICNIQTMFAVYTVFFASAGFFSGHEERIAHIRQVR